MIRLPYNDNDDTEDFGSEGGVLSLETSTTPIVRNNKSKKSFKWTIFVCIAILIAFGVFINRVFRSPSHKRPISQQSMSSINFVQTSKVQDPNIYNTTWRGDYAKRVLCKVLEDENCQSNYIADVIDLAWVVAPIYSFDPDSDWKLLELHRYFKGYIKSFGLNFITIEAIRFPGDEDQRPWSREPREYSETVAGNEPYDIQVYYYNVSYIRENLLNVAIRKLDKQKPWEYAIWIDGHQFFENSYWWEESIYKMEKNASVQLCGSIHYYGADNKSDAVMTYSVMRASLLSDTPIAFIIITGNAYGIRRDLYYAIDYIYDECIATSCDVVYTFASFPDGVVFPRFFEPYYRNFDAYVNRTKQIFKGSRTFVRGHMWHFTHGWGFPYGPVQESVGKNHFNASLHLRRDENFTLYITNTTISAELDKIILDFKHKNPWAH